MVDINLIGDDQTQFEDDDNEKDFQDTYSSDANELTQENYMRGETMDNSEYAKVLKRGRSKVGVYILFIVVIFILAATAYILFKPEKVVQDEPFDMENIADTGITKDSSKAAEEPSTSSAETEKETMTTPPATTLSPPLQQKIVELHHGVNTVTDIMNGIPANTNFTMLTYSSGEFLFELMSKQVSDLSDVSSILQQNMYSADVQTISQDTRYVNGSEYNQALIKGKIDAPGSSLQTSEFQQPQFMDIGEFKQLLTDICEENGLRIKQFDDGIEKTESNFILTPIIFRAYGLRGSVESALKQLVSANVNVSLTKVSLISENVDLSNPYINLVLNITLYQNI